MRLSPRKAEIEAVTAILTSDEYDSEQDMAKALIKTIAQILSERDTYGVGIGFANSNGLPGYGLVVGPYYSRADAQTCMTEAQEAGMEVRGGRLCGTTSIRSPEARVGGCGECGHHKELHPKSYKCLVLPTCGCKGFK
jgi:hypothetical protein